MLWITLPALLVASVLAYLEFAWDEKRKTRRQRRTLRALLVAVLLTSAVSEVIGERQADEAHMQVLGEIRRAQYRLEDPRIVVALDAPLDSSDVVSLLPTLTRGRADTPEGIGGRLTTDAAQPLDRKIGLLRFRLAWGMPPDAPASSSLHLRAQEWTYEVESGVLRIRVLLRRTSRGDRPAVSILDAEGEMFIFQIKPVTDEASIDWRAPNEIDPAPATPLVLSDLSLSEHGVLYRAWSVQNVPARSGFAEDGGKWFGGTFHRVRLVK